VNLLAKTLSRRFLALGCGSKLLDAGQFFAASEPVADVGWETGAERQAFAAAHL